MKRKYVRKLFNTKYPYDLEHSEALFVHAMRENACFHYAKCSDYKRILDDQSLILRIFIR